MHETTGDFRVLKRTIHQQNPTHRMKRNAKAHWTGDLKTGKGNLTTPSKVLDETSYSFESRFEDETGKSGTNPEELIAAAHAGCFTMALSNELSDAGYEVKNLDTKAIVAIEPEGEGFKIPTVDLTLTAEVPGISEEEFQKIAHETKENCPVSKVLNAKISLDATLKQ